jgi:hypothetical protein
MTQSPLLVAFTADIVKIYKLAKDSHTFLKLLARL